MEKLEKWILYKIIDEHIAQLEELSAICPDDKRDKLLDLKGDYEIVKKVFDTFYSIFDSDN